MSKNIKQLLMAKKPEKQQLKFLKKFNLLLGLLHAVQAVTVFILIRKYDVDVDIFNNYVTFNESTKMLVTDSVKLFTIKYGPLIAIFFGLSALAHFSIATWYQKRYEFDLKRGLNVARWIEYSVSASVMMVAISLLTGVETLSELIMIFFLTSVMNLTGLAMEVYNNGRSAISWLAYKIGCLAGIIPWAIIALYVTLSSIYGNGDIPGFVYGIYATIFVFFNCFAVNMWLQYKKIGPWKNYLFGENVYMILSLVAKSALAWQLFSGVFQP